MVSPTASTRVSALGVEGAAPSRPVVRAIFRRGGTRVRSGQAGDGRG